MFFIFLTQIWQGFLVKSIASFDDTLTRIPVITHLTKKRQGRVLFSIGTLLALTLILIIAIFFSNLLEMIPYTKFVVAGLIFFLAILVYFDLLTSQSNKQLDSMLSLLNGTQKRFVKIISIGFLISFVTLIDDAIVLVPLFLGDGVDKFLSVIGVYLAALLQILVVIYFGDHLEKIKYKKEVAAFSLVILSVLVVTGIV